MKKCLFISLFLIPCLMQGQGFETFYGSDFNDFGKECFQVPNENTYLTIHQISDSLFNDLGIVITKLDSLGNILWEKHGDVRVGYFERYDFVIENDGFRFASFRYNFPALEHCVEIKKFNFNGDLVSEAKYTLPYKTKPEQIKFLSDFSVLVFANDDLNEYEKIYKLSPEANPVWIKTYLDSELPYDSYSESFYVLPDDELLIVSTDKPLEATILDNTTVSKFDTLGNIEWQANLPDMHLLEAELLPFPEGDGYFIWGSGQSKSYIAKVDINGQFLWGQDFSSHSKLIARDGVVAGDNNSFYITSYITSNTGKNITLLELDSDGNVLWKKQYSGEFDTSLPRQLIRDRDGGLLISAATYPWFGTGLNFFLDPFVLKTDSNGELIWSWIAIHEGHYEQVSTVLTSDGGYLILGYVGETNDGFDNVDNYLIKLTAKGTVYANHITGQLVYDENLSCSNGIGEQPLADWKIKGIGNQTIYTITRSDGSFSLSTNSDSLFVSALPPNDSWASCPDPLQVVFGTGDTINVALNAQAIKNCPVFEVDISAPRLRRCFSNTYYLDCKNTGTVTAENLKLTVLLDPYFVYQNASLPLVAQNGNELTFEIGNLGVFESIAFTIQVEVSCEAELGQIHCVSVSTKADNECNNTGRVYSVTKECRPNSDSFDPNDKRAFSEGQLTDYFIPADSIIEYQIRFQNTGTDTAFNVVIVDTLSSLLDIESIIAGASSHPYRMELERNRTLKFLFEDIMLPDSNVNESASHGFVKFRIRHKHGLFPGNVIPNKAAIFFDFNDAVITNNLALEIKNLTSVTFIHTRVKQLLLYPQPATNAVKFEWIGKTTLPSSVTLEIVNLFGQVIYIQPFGTGVHQVTGLPAGQHFYRLRQNGEVLETGKLLVVKTD